MKSGTLSDSEALRLRPALVVEPHEQTRQQLFEMLLQEGYRVTAVDSVAKAWKACLDHDFILIIISENLNHANAKQLSIELRQQKGGERLSILILLDQLQNSALQWAQCPIDAIIRNPIDQNYLKLNLALLEKNSRRLYEMHHLADQLSELCDEQHLLLENAPGFLYRRSLSGHYFYLSDSVKRITGYTTEEWCLDPFGGGDSKRPEAIEDSPKPVQRFDIDIAHKFGHNITLEVTEMPYFGPHGEAKGIVGVAWEVTEQRRRELRIKQQERLEGLALLSGSIAHDFNNLLTGILGHSTLIKKNSKDGSQLHRSASSIEKVTHRLVQMTTQLLSYSGTRRLSKSSVDLKDLVQRWHKNNAHLWLDTPIKVGLEIQRELPNIQCDASEIEQLLGRLVTNSLEAIETAIGPSIEGLIPSRRPAQQGRVTIHLRHSWIDIETLSQCLLGDNLVEGEYVTLEVEDNGPGLTKQAINRIFDPFFSTKEKGQGLGLAAVHGIAKAHSGAIQAFSELGQGTRIQVLLPRPVAESRETKRGVSDRLTAMTQNRILVIDDEEPVREVAKLLLHELGYAVSTAENGLDGLAAFLKRRDSISAVLLDLTMPGMSGEDVYHELRRLKNDVPVIFMSGFNVSKTLRDIRDDLSFELQKPFTLEQLKNTVGSAVEMGQDGAGDHIH